MTQRTTYKLLFSLLCFVSGVLLLAAASALGSGHALAATHLKETLVASASRVVCVVSLQECSSRN